MPGVTTRTEFALALNQVCSERGIDPKTVLETVETAIAAAFRKDYGGTLEKIKVVVDSDSGAARVFEQKDNHTLNKDITPPGFGRIATQTAKQVILQKIREAERNAIIKDYSTRLGTLVQGTIIRLEGMVITFDIGRAQGIMPVSEQMPNERYRINQKLTLYIKEIREGRRGSEIILSRRAPELIKELFRREVPEVQNKSVEIVTIAREAGKRSKIAVKSTQARVDPVGSCVGQKGVRVQAVINEVNGEKIDIIQYHDDAALFIAEALSPATNISVKIDKSKKRALCTIPQDQLSLAIGREGQNVRLAAKLTGYNIDIEGLSESVATSKIPSQTGNLQKLGLSNRLIKLLFKAKIKTLADLKEKINNKETNQVKGLGPKSLKEIQEKIKQAKC